MKHSFKFKFWIIWILGHIIIFIGCIFLKLNKAHAQSGSIVPKQDTISPQVSHNAPYSYFPVYSFDTTKEGVIMRKVAECKNGVWKVFDSTKAETIIRNEYQKISNAK
jgi:hypothetical protein